MSYATCQSCDDKTDVIITRCIVVHQSMTTSFIVIGEHSLGYRCRSNVIALPSLLSEPASSNSDSSKQSSRLSSSKFDLSNSFSPLQSAMDSDSTSRTSFVCPGGVLLVDLFPDDKGVVGLRGVVYIFTVGEETDPIVECGNSISCSPTWIVACSQKRHPVPNPSHSHASRSPGKPFVPSLLKGRKVWGRDCVAMTCLRSLSKSRYSIPSAATVAAMVCGATPLWLSSCESSMTLASVILLATRWSLKFFFHSSSMSSNWSADLWANGSSFVEIIVHRVVN